MNVQSFIAPGPFARLAGIHFPNRRFQFSFTRDDGLIYIPQSEEGITLSLYASTGDRLFEGWSALDNTLPGYPNLYYQEDFPGTVTGFFFKDGYYSIVFDGLALQAALQSVSSDIQCYLVTEGDDTLETLFPRYYTDPGSGQLIAPGVWDVSIPYFSVRHVDTYPVLSTTVRTTTIKSSVPFQPHYAIQGGNALGWFLLPVLGVVWTPNDNLSGWVGLFQVDNVCSQGLIHIPWQYPEIDPPSNLPTSPEDRSFLLYENVALKIALGVCPDHWGDSTVAVSSDFGYQAVIPFIPEGSPLFEANYGLGPRPQNMFGLSVNRTYQFQWDSTLFQYDTGEGEDRYLGQSAVLIQSPVLDFENFTIEPLPENTE